MTARAHAVASFPSVSLPSHSGGLPVEVSLIAQLGVGSGDQLIASVDARQRAHGAFVDALQEPSARIGALDLARGDATSLYTFVVGEQGHPFHCHAGHRVFTAVSGSGGARLRFSTASQDQVAADPDSFVRALRHVDIPGDCLFTVRFGGGTWHQFLPRRGPRAHPALFALSCHTNELGGDLDDALLRRVTSNAADIPALTQLLPSPLRERVEDDGPEMRAVPTVELSLRAPAQSLAGRACAAVRDRFGPWRGMLGRRVGAGFLADGRRRVVERDGLPDDSLLLGQLEDRHHHQDLFELAIDDVPASIGARAWMVAVLEGFMVDPPRGVTRLMALRNVLVQPLGLRTSPLGCPVSSLLASDARQYFAGRFPVLAQAADAQDDRVQVLLGADDKHLQFRSCVGIRRQPGGRLVLTLGTRVRTRNAFGHFYLRAIDRVHRGYVTPAMLERAAAHALAALHGRPEASGDLASWPA